MHGINEFCICICILCHFWKVVVKMINFILCFEYLHRLKLLFKTIYPIHENIESVSAKTMKVRRGSLGTNSILCFKYLHWDCWIYYTIHAHVESIGTIMGVTRFPYNGAQCSRELNTSAIYFYWTMITCWKLYMAQTYNFTPTITSWGKHSSSLKEPHHEWHQNNYN